MRTDFRKPYYIGLDPATTMGVAIVPKLSNEAAVESIKGDPVQQLTYLMPLLVNMFGHKECELIFVMERLHHFQNAKTNRSLLERYGYLKHSIISFGYQLREVGPSQARKAMGTKAKEDTHTLFLPCYLGSYLTSDHTDALAAALWAKAQDGVPILQEGFRVYDLNQWNYQATTSRQDYQSHSPVARNESTRGS